jgi:hypothetical protein
MRRIPMETPTPEATISVRNVKTGVLERLLTTAATANAEMPGTRMPRL